MIKKHCSIYYYRTKVNKCLDKLLDLFKELS